MIYPQITIRALTSSAGACDGCGNCVTACEMKHEVLPGNSPIKIVPQDNGFVPLLCKNCHDAPCVTACMPGCRSKDESSGKVLTDYKRCVGCWMCVMVCPFGAIQRLPKDEGQHHGVALKCDGCLDEPEAPCVAACERKALMESEPHVLARHKRLETAMQFAKSF